MARMTALHARSKGRQPEVTSDYRGWRLEVYRVNKEVGAWSGLAIPPRGDVIVSVRHYGQGAPRRAAHELMRRIDRLAIPFPNLGPPPDGRWPAHSLGQRQSCLNWQHEDPKRWENYRHRPLTIRDRTTFGGVFRRLRRVLEREELIDEYFSISMDIYKPQQGLTEQNSYKGHWWWKVNPGVPYNSIRCRLAIYATTGGSEGHYTHVDLLAVYDPDPEKKYATRATWDYIPWLTYKTFKGWDHAHVVAKRLGELLAT